MTSVFVLGLTALALPAEAALLVQQGPTSLTGYPSDLDWFPPEIAADDFALGQASSITTVRWWGFYYDLFGFDLSVLDPDAAGVADDFTVDFLQGDLTALGGWSTAGTASGTLTRTYDAGLSGVVGYHIFGYELVLNAPVVLDPGVLSGADSFFLSVANNTVTTPDIDWIWWGSSSGNNHWFAPSTVGPAGTWEELQLDDLAFELEGGVYTGGQGTPVPEPATLALFGMGLAGVALSRKRRAH